MLAAGVSSSDILLASGHQSDAGLLYQLNSTRIRKPFQVVGGEGLGLSVEETFNMIPRSQVFSDDEPLVLRIPARLLPSKTLTTTSAVDLGEDSLSSYSSASEEDTY
jgi:hypothetical protein